MTMISQPRPAGGVLGGVIAFLLLIVCVPQATAQPLNADEAAIRAALAKWTADFNAGEAQAVCGLFAPDLVYDYRGYPERNYKDLCDLLQGSLSDRTKRYAYALAIKEILVSGESRGRSIGVDAQSDRERRAGRGRIGGARNGRVPQTAGRQLENHQIYRLRVASITQRRCRRA
ncbi:MAG: hypothetical protein ACXWVK_01030 [Rhodoplanes sp.]